MDRAAQILLEHGTLGIAVLALVYWLVKKDTDWSRERGELLKALAIESGARVDDAQKYVSLARELTSDVQRLQGDVALHMQGAKTAIERNTEATEKLTDRIVERRSRV